MISRYHYRPLIYFTTTFLVTFFLWFIGANISHNDELKNLCNLFMLPGLMAPFLISLVMIFTSGDKRLGQDYVARLTSFNLIKPGMFPLFFFIMPVAVIISILLSLLRGESVSQFHFSDGFSFSYRSMPVILILILAASFEELGWRGYAFDSLLSKYNYLTASFIFSILWSFWHLPLIFVKDSYQYEIIQQNIWFGINFFASIIPLGIIISWICIKNGKSVIAAILFHFIVNLSQEILEITQVTKCIETLVLFIFSLVIIVLDKELFFSRNVLSVRIK